MLRPLLLALAIICSSTIHAASASFALANNYPPIMTPEGGILGAILNEAKERLHEGHTIEIVSVPWARAVSLVKSGRSHALVGTYYRPQERPFLDPYSASVMEEHVSIFCRKGVVKSDWSYPEDFAGLKFGVVIGSHSAGSKFFEMAEKGDVILDKSPTIKSNLKKLASARIDCFVEGRSTVRVEMVDLKGSEVIEIVGDVKTESLLVGFEENWAKTPKAQAFIRDFNAVIDAMHKDGTIDEIIESFMR